MSYTSEEMPSPKSLYFQLEIPVEWNSQHSCFLKLLKWAYYHKHTIHFSSFTDISAEKITYYFGFESEKSVANLTTLLTKGLNLINTLPYVPTCISKDDCNVKGSVICISENKGADPFFLKLADSFPFSNVENTFTNPTILENKSIDINIQFTMKNISILDTAKVDSKLYELRSFDIDFHLKNDCIPEYLFPIIRGISVKGCNTEFKFYHNSRLRGSSVNGYLNLEVNVENRNKTMSECIQEVAIGSQDILIESVFDGKYPAGKWLNLSRVENVFLKGIPSNTIVTLHCISLYEKTINKAAPTYSFCDLNCLFG